MHEAVSLATVEGPEGLSIGELAKALGISKSGLYAHFGSKQELQLATIDEAERIAGMWHGGPWAAALWEARGVQRRAQKSELRALAAFDEAAARYQELGRPRDQARCLARMTPAGAA